MTYRKFTALARRVREEATPCVDIDRLKADEFSTSRSTDERTCRMRWNVAAVAMAACVAVLACVVLTRFRPLSPASPTSDPVGSVPSSDGISLTLQAPTWYAPGTVAVQELISNVEEDNGGRLTQAGVLDLSSRAKQVPGHESCGYIYYYTQSEKMVCCWHVAQAALQAEGLWEKSGNIHVLDYQPTRRIVLFLYEKENKRTAYLYDAEAQVLKKLNGPLWSAGTTIGRSLWAESERTYCLLLNTDRNREETLLLVNLLTGEMRSVAPWAHKSAEDGYFSPTGKYVIFTKGDSNVESVKRQTVVYTIATASIKEIQGQVRHILPDDSGMVVDTLDGLMLFCGDTGKVTPFDKAELPLRYRYHVQRGEQYANDCYPLLIVDLLTGETVTTLPQEVHAWQTDSQGRYLYYYVRERDGVTCRDIATGQEFSVPVSKEFVDMQRRYGDKEMQFYLLLDEQHKTLQLSYIRYDRPREDSQAIREQLAGDVSYQYTNRVQKGVSSLADFGTLIRQFPEGLILHRAEGYVYLDCTAWLGHAAYWVEDYRKGLFYYVHYNGRMGGIPLGIDGVTPLADGAKAHTEDLCRQYALPVASVAFDYGHLLTDNGVDWGALAAYNYAADRLLAEVDSYTVYSKEGLESGQATTVYSRESAEDMRQLREFLDFVNSLTYRHTDAYGKYQDSYQAIIHMPYDVYEATVWLGRYDGKPVVVLGTTYAHCTEEDYACWKNWALKKAEECYMPPAEEETEEEYTSTTTDTHKTVASRKSGVNGR